MPAELKEYFDAALKAERLADPLQRCLAYPDLPGHPWPEHVVMAHCTRVARPKALTLDELEQMLGQPDGATAIDARLSGLLDAHFQDPEQRDRIHEFFRQFDRNERSGAIATRWVRAAPESAFAMAALGSHRARLGWEARGTALSKDTSRQQLKRMEQHFLAAIPLLDGALAREPRLGPACVGLSQIGRMSSDALKWHALEHCQTIDPLSYYVVSELVYVAMPKWGGSEAALDAMTAYIREHMDRNPALQAQLAVVEMERLKARGHEGVDAYIAAARLAPQADVLYEASYRTHQWTRAVYLAQTLRFWPDYRNAREGRYAHMSNAELWDWVEVDLAWLVEHVPQDPVYRNNYVWLLMNQERFGEAVPHLRVMLALPDPTPGTDLTLCIALARDPRTADSDEVGECGARMIVAYPQEEAPWHWRARYLAERGQREALVELVAELRKVRFKGPSAYRSLLIRGIERYLEDTQ
ncbi:hypothetical protein B1992_08410 [Pseudoxanthomonas broegbernensis]|uniref:DUF4034 domain-containing protein n=1 Tax=Pseudoxanthomonas broegbernensis TaxID=83619 RepID=A0A7V8GM79_9GAMM|nr:hypothetical protein [Pseudoxanthomonas broegbernensis]KAF1686245.1 hypothetical protein B1992_08410 [Pseudoxanthomonas broegbernensis]MBB6063917.1 hypothetical protein [Pseudoxanthomonas broegbernensis]